MGTVNNVVCPDAGPTWVQSTMWYVLAGPTWVQSTMWYVLAGPTWVQSTMWYVLAGPTWVQSTMWYALAGPTWVQSTMATRCDMLRLFYSGQCGVHDYSQQYQQCTGMC